MRRDITGSSSNAGQEIKGWPGRTLSPAGEPDVDVFALTRVFVRGKKFIVAFVAGIMLLTSLVVLLIPNKYRSTAAILPSGTTDKMADLKELAGLGALTVNNENSSELFPVILKSHLIRTAVLDKEYVFHHDATPMQLTLAEYFDQDNPDKLRRALAQVTAVKLDKKSGVIDVAVQTKYPELSQAILSQYLVELESFNLHKRRSQAKDNAQYLARQMEETKMQLQQVEDSLEQFQLVNRDWASTTDPEILKMLTRLQRDVEMKTKTYLFLSQEHEIAKLDAQKDVPIVRILDQPTLPTQKSSPQRLLTVAVCGVMSFLCALFIVVVHEALKKRSAGPDRQSYQALRRDIVAGFPRVTRLISRRSREEVLEEVTR
ncbi:MAG TPA: GNVR domain-containing protein [Candidatus Deferrimicrobium sp.]|nr:GNVR domain-containing protein [Candidatus Deferrimicrobium sp.]